MVSKRIDVQPLLKSGIKWHPRKMRDGSRKPNAASSWINPILGNRATVEPNLYSCLVPNQRTHKNSICWTEQFWATGPTWRISVWNTPRIPERMGSRFLLRRNNHHIRMCARIHGVLITAHVIGGVIDTENLGGVDMIIEDMNCVSFFIGKFNVIITLKIMTQHSAKKVILQLRDKFLQKQCQHMIDREISKTEKPFFLGRSEGYGQSSSS